ncbi:MAG: ATP-dependent Clp protease proteolytic subunit, partial [Nitrosopumilaceae archaeon]
MKKKEPKAEFSSDDTLGSFLEDELEKNNKYFFYSPVEVVHKIHHFYLSSDFEEPHRYSKMFHILAGLTSNDTVLLHINTGGGELRTGVQLINSIRACQANVIGVIEAECSSLGVFVFLAANHHIVHENCIMLLHNFRGGTYGKGNEQEREIRTTIKWFSDLSKDLLIPFLSEDELKRMLQGEDFW